MIQRLFCLSLLVLLAACKPPLDAPSASRGGKPHVYVANYPLQFFAERLGGDQVEVQFPAPADEDPAFWQPDDATLARYQAADLILLNGATYSKWAEKATLPESKITNTSQTFAKAWIETKDAVTHSHGSGGDHSHGGIAFTTWLDFQQAIQQAEAVAQALKSVGVPEATVAERLDALKAELRALDERLLAVGRRIANAPLVASHPVYQYLARRYRLNVKAVLWEPEVVPDATAWDDLKKLLSEHPAKWMIWEGEPAPESVAKLTALGVQSLVFDPCGNVPDQGDFLDVMKANVAVLEKAFP